MAKRGKEIQLQQPLDTQEEWEDMLSKEGVCVVDVYQEWAGNVTCLIPNLRRLKNELGDDLLKFYTAKADTIDALEKYRGRCEPCFLFYATGNLVAVIRGANAPLILRTITEQLAQEHKVLEGSAERKPIKDTMIDQLEARDREKEEEEEEQEEAKKEVSVVIIKPDAVKAGQAEAIMEEMKARGIEILRQEERLLTEDEVKNVYILEQDMPYFNDLVAYMTSSPCIVLAITKGKTGQNIIGEFRELMGPTEVEQAKEQQPESLRAKFGSKEYMNAVHGSDSADTAARELAFFFPDFVAPPVDGEPKVQRTLALIRPDAYKNHKDEIVAKIREAGFKIAMQKEIQLSKEQAEDFYKEHQGQEYFEELTTRMSSGPLLALGLAREDAVAGWRQMLGPTKVDEAKEQQPDSLRAQFIEEGAAINMLHGSDSEATAQKELEYFFPMEQTVAVIKPDAYGTKDEIIEKIHQSGFRIAAHKETTLSREIAEDFYAEHKDKEYYEDLVQHMVSGPTYFMVLSREGAVDGWRSLIGATDPEEAKQVDPESIRGKFGQDKLKNAVHGSSNIEHASHTISKIFGDLQFCKDGSVKEDQEEEAISEQQQVNYEVAPEHGGSSDQQEQKQAEDTEKPEGEAEGQEAEAPEAGSAEQTQEQTPSDQKQEDETKPTDEGQAQQEEQKEAQQTEEPPKEPEEQKQEEAAPAEQQQEEAAPAEQKQEEAAPAEQTQEESAPSEQKQEEAAPTEQKQEDSQQQKDKEGDAKDAKDSEEKKEEAN